MFLTLLASTSLTPPVVIPQGGGGGAPIWWLGVGGDMGYRPINPRKVLPHMRAAIAKPAPAPQPAPVARAAPAPVVDLPLVLAERLPQPVFAPIAVPDFSKWAPPTPYDDTEDLVLLLAA